MNLRVKAPPIRTLFALSAALAMIACAVSPLGRRQLAFFPDAQLAEMGVTAFNQLKVKTPESKVAKTNSYVKCVARSITAVLQPGESPVRNWEVVVFESDDVNAFALPGGKIGVYTGLLKVAKTQDQLAAVIGHEIAHVLARHSNERVSTAYTAQAALTVAGEVASPQLMALLGLGAQVGVILPFSRTQETEADLLGLDFMARAGFDPRQSVALWQGMAAARTSGASAEFMSTHPSDATRISKLTSRMPRAISLYDAARNMGRKPRCG
jgi:predicted Zn-dependent protease